MLVSAWAHQNRHWWMPNYNKSLDEWVQGGKAEAFVDYYSSFFIDFEAPDPWSSGEESAFADIQGPWIKDPGTSRIQASNITWKEQFTAAVNAGNNLVLLQEFPEQSLAELAKFLQLTPEELEIMKANITEGSGVTKNAAPS